MIFQKRDDKLLIDLAVKNNMDMDKVISAYLICGKDAVMLLHCFEGQDIHIPSKRKLNALNLSNISYIEDDELKYRDYVKGNVIEIGDKEYKVVSAEKRILNHYYLPVVEIMENEDGTDE
jgi:hypothetical protein